MVSLALEYISNEILAQCVSIRKSKMYVLERKLESIPTGRNFVQDSSGILMIRTEKKNNLRSFSEKKKQKKEISAKVPIINEV